MTESQERERGPEEVVRAWFTAYQHRNFEAAYMLVDEAIEVGVMGVTMANGVGALRAMDERLLREVDSYRAEVRTLAVAGRTVMVERVDHLRRGSDSWSIPVCGVFDVTESGLIASVREYLDPGAAAAFIEN